MTSRTLSSHGLPVTLRALARLLDYPDAAMRADLPDVREALHAQAVLGAARLAALDALIDTLIARPGLESEAVYVDLFDRGRGTALHLFEHVHGDSRDRGPAMIDLIQTYEAAGMYLASNELPDHLTVLLEYASTQPPQSAVGLLGEVAHIVQTIFSALTKRESDYASVLGALLDLAGQPAQPVAVPAEPALDESWSEPEAFGACPSASISPDAQATAQAAAQAGAPQPIRIVRGAAASHRSSSSPSSSQGASA
ncbi:nitrate reductase molybdenum cofactor assembly chaperone [Paraburkholderia kururiensis]|uniref:Nitrate reductase molybdenum cofactor assembly chaperone n=1 Tax=Paraburkholderia kururiensis TaxID=984307 RepID=A0ABZ0WJP7_9BURK|nr:nitrate reductase molybdenum cofactor assembly chaperone [Paraburkholderia kururiensis]WQD77552.1 nitrate reductase molybdenum cofactor assembly chaperone [Paraburkholderia kururiensis]